MSRILLVGMGVPGMIRAARHAGPGLRAAHFASALAAQGHEVLLLAVLDPGEVAPPAQAAGTQGASTTVEFTDEKALLSPAMRARIDSFAPEAVVGVTVYAASLAARLSLGIPLWADAFGDIMAEAQAKSARLGSDWSIVHFWTLLRGVLEAADRFSAVSAAQSHALIGQLGLAGRLSARTAGEDLVATIPCAAEPGRQGDRRAARSDLGFSSDHFVVLVSGGVNTWCDVETLARGVAMAMQAEPRLRLVVTGGAIPGHDEASHPALVDALRTIPPARLRVLGWVDSARLADIYAAADVALLVERDLYERRLGAENRVVEWLAHGLACITTARSETGATLVAQGLAFGCRPGDEGDLARVIRELAGDSAAGEASPLARAGLRGREWVTRTRGYTRAAEPLTSWCSNPRFARDRSGSRLVRLGLLSHPHTSIEMLETYAAALPARELARRGLRLIARRLWVGVSGWLRRTEVCQRNRQRPDALPDASGERRSAVSND